MGTSTGKVEVQEGLVFGQGGGRDLRCDVYLPPDGARNGAAVVLLHGGSWLTGDRTQLRGYGILLGREGFVCVAPEYRLLGEAPWPAQIDDAKAAVRWTRAHAAAWGVDPGRIAVEGNSAGGHLALLVAGTAADTDESVSAVIAVYPPTILFGDARNTKSEGGRLLMGMFGDGDEGLHRAQQASPITHASPTFPPTLLIHGTDDTTVPHAASVRMFEALQEAGVAVDLHLIAQQEHAFDAQPQFGRLCAAEMKLFLTRYVLELVPG